MIAATLFSGIGAPEIAMPHWDWRWHAEIEKFPSAVMAARHPQSINLGDVTADDFAERAAAAGRPDVIVFGSPCQDFSVAGKRLGLDGARGNLALCALRIIARLKPRWFVFENVPGLLSNWSGAEDGPAAPGSEWESVENCDFAAFLGLVDECGYSGAWASLDAQYAGLAQRRERLFFVGHLGDWRGPAAVLFESESMCGNHPPSREARKDVAPTISARTQGGGGLGTDFDLDGGLDESPVKVGFHNNQGHGWCPPAEAAQTVRSGDGNGSGGARESTLVAFGGNNTAGPIDLATAVRAKGGSGHGDFESETFIAQAFKPSHYTRGKDGAPSDLHPPLSADADKGDQDAVILCFDGKAGGNTSFSIGDVPGAQRASHGGGHATIAFSSKDHGADAMDNLSPTLRAGGHDGSHANAGVPPAVAFQSNAGSQGGDVYLELSPTLRVQNGGGGGMPAVAGRSAVRRRTPMECERLQGVPDNFTAIQFRGKPAADGPRYKALGNSMAVPVIRLILTRIEIFDRDIAPKL